MMKIPRNPVVVMRCTIPKPTELYTFKRINIAVSELRVKQFLKRKFGGFFFFFSGNMGWSGSDEEEAEVLATQAVAAVDTSAVLSLCSSPQEVLPLPQLSGDWAAGAGRTRKGPLSWAGRVSVTLPVSDKLDARSS